jgi:hypothetical protein
MLRCFLCAILSLLVVAGNRVWGQSFDGSFGLNPSDQAPANSNYNPSFFDASAPVQEAPINGGDWSFRMGYAPTYYGLSLKKESVPVHPDDAGFLSGSTDVRVGSGIDWLSFDLGIQRNFHVNGWAGVTPKVGFDADLSLLSVQGQNNNGSRSMLYEFKRFNGDTRPASQASFVYDKFAPGIFTPVPFIGADFRNGDWTLSTELGFAYKDLTREYGWNRFAEEEKYGSFDEWCFSPRPAIGLSYAPDEKTSLGVFGSYEWYTTSFGKVIGIKLMLLFQRSF